MKQTLYLIRHGITAGTSGEFMYGSTELPLTEEGVRKIQERVEKEMYPELGEGLLYSSGMGRAEHTLELIYGDADHQIVPDIREIDFGKWEMMNVEDIKKDEWGAKWLAGEIELPEFEGGDSITGFVRRVGIGMRFILDDATSKDCNRVIVVCHGGTIAATMESYFPRTVDSIWEWVCEPATGYRIELEDGRAVTFDAFGVEKKCGR